MKKVNFIGAYDKTDCILYVAKILTTVGKKVLVVDTTITQKAKYVVPTISPTVSYITSFEDIDVAVGFDNLDNIKNYLSLSEGMEWDYDYVFIDIDNEKAIKTFDIQPDDDNYFVTAFDMYSLRRGLEIFENLKQTFTLTKIIFSKEMLKEEDDYLNFLSKGMKIVWKEYLIYFPTESGDMTALAENQRLSKIKFKQLSVQYKESLLYIATDILKDVSESQIRRAMRIMDKEKGV